MTSRLAGYQGRHMIGQKPQGDPQGGLMRTGEPLDLALHLIKHCMLGLVKPFTPLTHLPIRSI